MKVAAYYEQREGLQVVCGLCPHRCELANGDTGLCGVRQNLHGKLMATTYGQVAAFGVDPIEKKPLYHFHPGKLIASFGGSGCNMTCQYCQNHHISQVVGFNVQTSPKDIVKKAMEEPSSIGLAATYNEPIIQYEFITDIFELNRKCKKKNVLVTNGYIEKSPLSELVTLVDAFNVDLKGFTDGFYHRVCGAKLSPVMESIEYIYDRSHLELTFLLIPGHNDDETSLQFMFEAIRDISPDIPLHINRYLPNYLMTDPMTPLANLIATQELALEYLNYVYIGNVSEMGNDTKCKSCGHTLVERGNSGVKTFFKDRRCPNCSRFHHLIFE